CGVSAKRQAELAAAEAGKAAAEAVRCAPTEPLPPTVETKLGQAKSAQEKLGDLVKRLKGEADPARQKELELQEVLKAKERAETLLKALKVEKGLLEEQLGTARTEARMAKEEAIQAKERAAEAMATARKAEVQMQTIKTKAEEEVKAAKMPGPRRAKSCHRCCQEGGGSQAEGRAKRRGAEAKGTVGQGRHGARPPKEVGRRLAGQGRC
ncbi:Uncharacterized protein SCF082_LOCUS44915, partial [Durusdinium trenchii]